MIRWLQHWGLASVASLVLHVAIAVIYLGTRTLDDPPEQSGGEQSIAFEALDAPRQEAEAQAPDATQLENTDTAGETVAAGVVRRTTAQAISPTASPTQPVRTQGANIGALRPDANRPPPLDPNASTAKLAASNQEPAALADAEDRTERAAPQRLESAAIKTGPLPSEPTPTSQADPIAVAATAAPTQVITTVSEPAAKIEATIGLPTPLSEAAPPTSVAPIAQPVTLAAMGIPAQSNNAPSVAPSSDAAPSPPLPSERTKAATAWQFSDRIVTDPAAVETIQAFMTPSAPGAENVRDDLSATLEGLDCARVSATFLPDSGVLEMRGHVPDPELRNVVLAAMQEQVGEGIPVRANLLHLPSPQCDALTGISSVGLPQSTDQFTDARLIGPSAHARAYTYSEGQRLTFDLAAPDYDAYLYVDYFNADGEVIHLIPNETVALERLPAKSQTGVGVDRPGKPSLRITIGPPFGQEIAVAFASSEPLYDGLRPIIEPAEPYLDYLRERVSAARERTPEFKGEWVYFFISTEPATQ